MWKRILVLIGCLALSACGPSDKQRAEFAEQRRIECLDKICLDDTPPQRQPDEELLKLNGQWFVGPREYFSSAGVAGFEWWNHKPLRPSLPRPSEAQALAVEGKGYDISIEIFFRHHDGVMHGLNRIDNLKLAEAEGRLVSKIAIRPGLEQWRLKEASGLAPGVWYVATAYVAKDPNAAVLWCKEGNREFDRCTTASLLEQGIAWDVRFRAKHAQDWPEIYQEIHRVTQLLKRK